MSSVYRFPGGIHPQEGVGGKAATAGLPIVEAPQPSRVAIPLQQHIGAPCKPLVQKGDTVKVSFARDFYGQIEMNVDRIGTNEAGYRMLVLSCGRYMQNVTLLRQQSADIVFSSYAGLRVPKEAIRVDESGQAGVYVREGSAAKWKPVTILHDNGESYVVELDRSSTDNLWPGDEVIVTAKKLYDGKVVG